MSAVAAISANGRTINLEQQTIDGFQSKFKGNLLLATDPGYDESRAIWNGMIDKKPCLIAQCRDADDVMAAVNFARDNNLKFSIRGGGHHVAGKSICDDGLVIDLSLMNKVNVNPDKRTATVQGGAKLIDIDTETAKYNLFAPLGAVSDTGVAGLTLHGGYGWQTRKHGLSLDNISSVDIVTADGKLRRASEKENPDLFWAIRGGGGNFGVVTSFEFNLYPVDEKVWLLLTFYPVETARKALQAYREYMPKAPDELSSIALFWNAPAEEFIPENYRGQPVFIIAGCYTGSHDEAEKAIAPFRRIDTPIADVTSQMPFADIQKFLDADYPNGRHYYWKSAYLDELSDEMIDLLIEKAASRPSPLTSVDVWGLGGKASRIDPKSTAFYQRKAPFMISMESNWDNPSDGEKNVDWTRDFYNKVVEKTDIGQYLNFSGFGEEGDELLKKAYGPNYNRLKKIKAKYDPDNFFQGVLNFNGK
jgi:FAD/FMN-containing dehydrogenase